MLALLGKMDHAKHYEGIWHYDQLPGDLFLQVDVQRAGASVFQAEGTGLGTLLMIQRGPVWLKLVSEGQ